MNNKPNHQRKIGFFYPFGNWGLLIIGMVIILGCGIRIPNPDSDDEENTITVEGTLASTDSDNGAPARTARQGETIHLLTSNGATLSTAETDKDGFFRVSYKFKIKDIPKLDERFPLFLETTSGKEIYSAAIATFALETTANVNEITSAVSDSFVSRSNRSQEMLDAITELIVVERFGTNEEGEPEIPVSVFTTGNFQDPDHLGRYLLDAARKQGVRLRDDFSNRDPLLTDPDFLDRLIDELRPDGKPGHSGGEPGGPPPVRPLIDHPGGQPLLDELTTIATTENPSDADKSKDKIRDKANKNSPKHKDKVNNIKNNINNLDKKRP